ncbi:cadherin-like beta sandwich domain-containing protein [Mucilaginibacter celer]|uniref:Fibronectin type-III domain-containing protein n=1 Tax=Mucilaginibacter celer TaxID=2305508 RepID=A0A494VLI7_9SPHI|nr:cadherin-like beta sandwich domain-containing protein [Mucilaginibacter celer]AYL96136.1 hypothetical protein HYN43_012915 [Mucilaginibacter celer]
MLKHLLLLKKHFSKLPGLGVAFVLMLMLLGLAGSSQAQVYYLTNDATSGSSSGTDGISRMGYDGASATALGSGFTNSPALLQVDLPNNRAFVYEAFSSSPPTNLAIKVVNLTSGAVITTIPLALTGRIQSIKYDPINDYIYYVVQDATPTSASTTNDALIRVKPDGTGSTTLITGFCTNPSFLALDIAHNRVFVYQNLFSDHSFKVLTLSGNTASLTATLPTATVPAPMVGVDCEYDAATDYIYFLTSDNAAGTTATANDALYKMHSDGTGQTTVKASVIPSVQYQLALDAGNNRAFLIDNSSSEKAIYSVSLADGTTTKVKTVFGVTSSLITGIWVPARAILSTTAASNISSTTVTLGGNITRSDVSVTERGVVYSSSNTTPTTADSKVTGGTGTGSFTVNTSGLSPVTTYYVRAYAISGAGTSYGSVQTFTTLSNDASLSALTTSSGSLSPSFSGSTTAYNVSVSNATTSITVTPTRNNANATIKVNGTAVTSGTASGSISLNVGDNTITVVGLAQDGITTRTYTLTVNRAKFTQVITFAALPSKTYGNADFAPGATVNSSLTVSYSSDNTAVATIVGGQIHVVSAGTANITASQAGDANNLAAANVTQSLTVSKAAVTVTANAASKTYGDADPSLTYGITTGALVGSDTFSGSLSRAAGTDAGTYAITQGSLALSANYTLSFVGANLTVNKRPITIAPVPASKVYGDADPGAYPYNIAGSGLAGSDGMSGSFTRAAGEIPGTYALALGTKHPINSTTGVDQSNNYTLTFTPEYLTISKRAITLKPQPATKVYGSADPAFPYQFVVGSVAPGEGMTGSFGRAAGEDVGTYALTLGTKGPVNASTGVSTADYYTISFVSDNLTITKKTINVTANLASKVYGDADPTLPYTADALSFGDTFTGALTRAAGESVGTYAISQGTLALNAGNYTLNFTGSTFTISKKVISVTANAATKAYGDADPAFTYTADALVGSDSFSGSLTRSPGEIPGNYAINQGSLALSNNYTISYTSADLTIGKRSITVNANLINKQYGDADPALTYTLTGSLVTGDAFSGSLSRQAGESTGSYVIQKGTLTAGAYYDITFNENDFVIAKRNVTVNINSASKYYGDPDPDFTYTIVSGSLLPGDHFTGALTRAAGETGVQNYAITRGTLAIDNPDYTLSVTPSVLAINQAPLTVTVDNKTKKQGEANPVFTFTYSGFKNGEGPADLVSQAQATTTAGTNSPAGTYSIYAGYVASPNYTANYVDGVLTILPVSHDASLSNITLAGLSLSPAFDSATTFYEADAGDANSVTITPTVNEAHATLTINGDVATSGSAKTYSLYGGTNYIQVNVTAEDGTSTNSYLVLVNKNRAVDANLTALSIGGNAVPGFDPNVTTYALSVPYSTASVTVAAVLSDPHGMVSLNVNGTPVEGGAESPVNLIEGDNVIKVKVRAENPSVSKTYTVTVHRAEKVNDASLASLTTSPVSLLVSTSVSGTVVNYTTSVDPAAGSISLIATAKYALSTIKINGVTTPSGAASAPISLTDATTVISTVVTAPDGVTTKTYNITVNKTGSNDALVGLTMDPSSILVSAGVVGNQTTYNTSVAAGTTSVRITPKGRDANVSVKINDVPVANQTQSAPIPLNASGVTPVTVVATAQDGVTVRNYVINVSRNGSNNVNLAGIKFSAPSTTVVTSNDAELARYTVTVGSTVSSITLQPTLQDPNATLYVNGLPQASGAVSDPINLFSDRPTPVNVYVAAQDGVSGKLYIYSFVRSDAQNTTLTLKLDPSSVLIKTGTTANVITYTTSVSADVSSVTITPTAAVTGTSIKVNGSVVNSGSASAPIALNATGTTSIGVVITAADGITTKTNTVIVSKTGSNNASASFRLNVAGVPVVTSSSGSVYNYSVSVDNAVNSVKVIPTTQNAFATTMINGLAVANNTESASIALNASGETIVTAIVTAEDGLTTKTYNIAIKKNGSNDALVGLKTDVNSVLVSTGIAGNQTRLVTSVGADVSSLRLTATGRDPNVTIKMNGVPVLNGVASDPIALNATGVTTVTTEVTAQDGVTVRIFILEISRNGSNNAGLASFKFTPALSLTTVSNTTTAAVSTATVANSVSSVKVTPVAINAGATITVNGSPVNSGVLSDAIALAVGINTVTIAVTAEDGVTTKTYTVNITRDAGGSSFVARNNFDATNEAAALTVHSAVSPNGDGINDVLTIDGINSYPENKLSIINSTGLAVNEIKNYDNSTRVFDGHAQNGTLQKPGTYFYVLEYQDGKETKRKTGYIILKY